MKTFSPDSLASQLSELPQAEREALVANLTEDEARSLLYEWRFWAREKQITPATAWLIWVLLAGRGFGKTRTAGEWIRDRVEKQGARYLIFAGATAGDVREIMIEGESGILAISPPWFRPKYLASKAKLVWPNGATALLLSADEPERFRGKQSDTFWADEVASWRYPEAWTQLQLGFRLGRSYGVKPQGIVSTTPRPTPLIKKLATDARNHVTRGSTYENKSNLTEEFLDEIVKQYEGTRLGRQELDAEILDDNPGALWKREWIDESRVMTAPQMRIVVIAIDPSVSSNPNRAETGIVSCGLGDDGDGYLLNDYSLSATPAKWGEAAVTSYVKERANYVIGEVNNGGQLVEDNVATALKAANIAAEAKAKKDATRFSPVLIKFEQVHASRGKAIRAEPIAGLSQQGRIHHVGTFAKLEDQLCEWDPTVTIQSPDRLDAYVWGFTKLMLGPAIPRGVHKTSAQGASHRLGTGRGYGG